MVLALDTEASENLDYEPTDSKFLGGGGGVPLYVACETL